MYGGHQVCEALVPVLIGIIIDRAVATGDLGQLIGWIAALAVLFVILSLMWRFGARVLTYAEAGEGATLRVEVAEQILDPAGIDTDLTRGELLSISSSDADNASYLLDYIPRLVAALTAAVVSAAVLLRIHAPLGIAVVLATALVIGVLARGAPLITRRVEAQQEAAGLAAALATDLVTGLRPLRGIRAQSVAVERYRRVSRSALAATLRAARIQRGFEGLSAMVSNLLAAGIAIAAGWLALRGTISIGEFVTVVGLAQFLIEPFAQLTVVPSWIAEARASANRVAAVCSAPTILPVVDAHPRSDPDGRAITPAGDLEFDGVAHDAFSAIDLRVPAGDIIGIVALDPVVGDAVVEVLSGRLAPTRYSGQIRYAGVDLRRLGVDERAAIVLVDPHQPDLFTGTLRSNIVAGAPEVERSADFAAALVAAAVTDVVDGHPDGLDAEVTERGASLSGGQRQRVALARALYADTPVLVLHDPTTAVDAVTEQAVAQGIIAVRHPRTSDPHVPDDAANPRRTTVLVTGSPALLAVVDHVTVVDSDGVVDAGTHAELLSRNARYRQVVLR